MVKITKKNFYYFMKFSFLTYEKVFYNDMYMKLSSKYTLINRENYVLRLLDNEIN